MKIAHLADLHYHDRKEVLADTIKCTDFALDVIREEQPDIILLAGDTLDFYRETVALGSPACLAALSFVQRCADIAPVVIIRGTSTHDAEGSVEPFTRLKAVYPIYATDRPEQVAYCPDDGFVHSDGQGGLCCPEVQVMISCLPSITKANLLPIAQSRSIETTSREVMDIMRDILQAWGVVNRQARDMGIPTVLIGHGTVTGSVLSTGQTMVGRDIEYTTGDLRLAGCDLYCLGHIHKSQSWGNIFYSGSITRLDFGEVEEKGFYIHDIDPEGRIDSKFVQTPARAMRTKKMETLPGIDSVADVQPGENVRIVYEISEADVGKVDEAEIERLALEKGAASIKIEKRIIPAQRLRSEGISRLGSLNDKLLKWGEVSGTEITEGISQKLVWLEAETPMEQFLEELNGRG